MRFASEREQRLAGSVMAQMISLIESLLHRMETVDSEADLSQIEAGRLLLDAVCMPYVALGEAVKQRDKLTGLTLQEQAPDQDWKGIMGFRDVLAHQYLNLDERISPRTLNAKVRRADSSILQTLQIRSGLAHME
jgi:uncharacterized protein with HEPN domain